MISDDERIALITQIVERADDHSSFHGYPANQSWLWGIIEKAVDATLMAERDERTVEEIFECQDILDVFSKDPPKPQYATGGLLAGPIPLFQGGVGGASGPLVCAPMTVRYSLPQVAAPRGGLNYTPPIAREPQTPERAWRRRVEDYHLHSPNWLNGPEHKDAIPFYGCKVPKRRRHKCWAQTWGTNTNVIHMEYCPCGGWRMDGQGDWIDTFSAPEDK